MIPTDPVTRRRRGDEARALGADLALGRVARTDRGWVTVWTDGDDVRAACATAAKDAVTGDWVAVDLAAERVEHVLERETEFVRRAARGALAPQTLAANIDVVWCVQALVPGVAPRRLERELVLAHQSGAAVDVVLTKVDLVATDDATAAFETAGRTAPGSAVHVTSAVTGSGIEELRTSIPSGSTVSLIGSSGVGKSRLVNAIAGREVQLIGEVRAGDSKGRHTTTAAQLIDLGDLVLLDTPGTRALALWEADDGLTATFPEILELSERCRFEDCRHTDEPGCAVIAAAGTAVDVDRLESFRRLRDELDDLDSELAEQQRRSPDR